MFLFLSPKLRNPFQCQQVFPLFSFPSPTPPSIFLALNRTLSIAPHCVSVIPHAHFINRPIQTVIFRTEHPFPADVAIFP